MTAGERRISPPMLPYRMTIIWNEAEIGGRKCASIHFEQKRLYVVERFGKVEAWIDGVRVGSYADLREAKEAILKIRRPKFSLACTGL
jgi:uncharacterized protein YycO